ncbi:MAG: ABC transporter permease [Actinobacteria bacterium]|nr:ABC transporter permease [Actinomycetota bacterium]
MGRYIAKRIAWGAVTLFLFVTMLFFLVNVLVPGDFTSQFIMTGEQREALAEQLGLNRSLWAQYWDWITALASGNLGYAFRGGEVATLVKDAMATTLLVFVAGLAVAFPLGNWLGRLGAWKGRGFFLGSSSFVAIVFFTAFPPSLAFLLERALLNTTSPGTFLHFTRLEESNFLLADRFGRVPEGVTLPTPTTVLWRMTISVIVAIVVVALLDRLLRKYARRGVPLLAYPLLLLGGPWLYWWLAGWNGLAMDLLGTLLLLVVGVVLLFYGELQLVTEAAMEDAVDADYVLTARAKGLKERQIRDRHAARASLLPVLSRLVVSLPYFLTGLVIMESVFGVPGGLGNLVFNSIRNQDTPVVVGAMVVIGVISLAARLVMDVVYALLDPRIRYGSGTLEVEVG